MTGYQSKRAMAQAKTIDEVNWADHEPNGLAQPHSPVFTIGNAVPWVMRITADRRIEVNEDVEVKEAAQKVLDALQHLLLPQPEQRTWVGLTDEEAQQTFAKHNCTISTHLAGILARAVEAKLKEKNT